jgi:hypothetical protein
MAPTSQQIPAAALEHVLELARLAPSVHNSQPWRWRTTKHGLELRSDQRRRLMATDPSGRDLVISCGAALHTAVVAAAAEGWSASVHRRPEPADEALLARLTFRRHSPADEELAAARVIEQRRTDRRQTTSWPVPLERIERMRRTAAALGVFAVPLTDPTQVARLDALRRRAAEVQGRDAHYHDELLTWSQDDPGVGLPSSSRLSRSDEPDRFTPGALADPGTGVSHGADPGPKEPVWLVLATSSDDPLSWLRTGEALQAVWLWCAAEGLSLRPHSQPVEVDEVRRRLQTELLDDTVCPQLLVSVGWAASANEPVPPTPRLSVKDVSD